MNVENYHAFHIKFYGHTATKPCRIKIKSLRFNQYVWVTNNSMHYEKNAVEHLNSLGFNIIGLAEYSGKGFILFSDTFKPFY